MAERSYVPAPRLSLQNLVGLPPILDNIVGYLRYAEICQLELTCREINHELKRNARVAYRRVDLANPLRDIKTLFLRDLQRKGIAQHVRSLILDGNDNAFGGPMALEYSFDVFPNLRLLSCLEMPHQYAHLMRAVETHLVGHRADSTYTLAVYHFTSADWTEYSYMKQTKPMFGNNPDTSGIGETWYKPGPRIYQHPGHWWGEHSRPLPQAWRPFSTSWASLISCYGTKLAFDVVPCLGPTHEAGQANNHRTAASKGIYYDVIADVPIGPDGCHDCHSISEDVPRHGVDHASPRLPVLRPVPRFGTSFAIAKRCATEFGASKDEMPLHVRCVSCARDRRCLSCLAFWCETCFPNTEDVLKYKMQRLCKDCGPLCATCNEARQKTCKCGTQYCGEHADGCASGECDVCFTTAKFEELSWL